MEEEANDHNNQKEGRQNNDDGNPASTKRLKKTNDSIPILAIRIRTVMLKVSIMTANLVLQQQYVRRKLMTLLPVVLRAMATRLLPIWMRLLLKSKIKHPTNP